MTVYSVGIDVCFPAHTRGVFLRLWGPPRTMSLCFREVAEHWIQSRMEMTQELPGIQFLEAGPFLVPS